MPYCPNCQIEYMENIKDCKDCKMPLAEKPSKQEPLKYDTEVFLTQVYNEIEAQMIINILKNAGIPCLRKYIANGDMMKIYGFVNFGSKLYVPSKALEKARKLIAFQSMDTSIQYQQPDEKNFFDKDIWFNAFFWLIMGIIILIAVLSFIG